MTHREKLDHCVIRAREIVDEAAERDFTADEMADLIGCITMATVQFKRLPGATEAFETVRAAAEIVRQRRVAAKEGGS